MILAVANLLAHNNTSQICYLSQISLQSVAVFPDTLEVISILLAMVHVNASNLHKIVDTYASKKIELTVISMHLNQLTLALKNNLIRRYTYTLAFEYKCICEFINMSTTNN